MSKKCIVERNGTIGEVVEAGDEFPIFEGTDDRPPPMKWVDVPDDVDLEDPPHKPWIMHEGEFIDLSAGPKDKDALMIARKVAYGTIEEQLDMQYRDKINGTTEWDDHIAKVKKDNPAPKTGVEPTTLQNRPDTQSMIERGDKPHWEKP